MFEQEINLCSKPLGLESFLSQQQNSAEPRTVIPFGDADERLRDPVAEEAWLAEPTQGQVMELDSYGKFSRGLCKRGGLEEQEGGAGGKKGLQKTAEAWRSQ